MAETTGAVRDFGLCLKTLACLHDLNTDFAGVRAGSCGACACITASESGGEKTDTTNRNEDLTKHVEVVS